ncbi:hypothetical protein BROUX41_005203 [Berkeleyomyces rouxiae]|uniref:uncharacterized protein n=1 Tax=Berkeleyomyces rouxiae TaxID=2035830 RepID=UPI003B77308E
MAFVYVTRLYINKTALSAIPKSWLPIQKGDVKLPVWKMINSYLSRSAAIAFASRPRTKRELGDSSAHLPDTNPVSHALKHESAEDRHVTIQRTQSNSLCHNNHQAIFDLPASVTSVWNDIEHPGWSSPNAPDMPDVQYSVVYGEIPDMIEAKAFTLAPTDLSFDSAAPLPHPDAMAVLQRPTNMSLRDYITHLSNYNVIPQSANVSGFLTIYERAKYSTHPLPGTEFREMMSQFAQMLQSMQPLDLTAPEYTSYLADDDHDNTSLYSSLAPSSPSFRYADAAYEGTQSLMPSPRSINPSVRGHLRPEPPTRSASATAASYLTAPTTPQMRQRSLAHSSSMESLSPSPYPLRMSRMASSASLQSRSSFLSSSGSVVHKSSALPPQHPPS